MATVPHMYKHEKSGQYRILFRFPVDGKTKQFHKSLKTDNERKADAIREKIHQTLEALERGHLEAPSEAGFWSFLLSGGKSNGSHKVKRKLPLCEMFEKYEKELPPGSLEENTLATYRIHKTHLMRVFGEKAEVENLKLKEYIRERSAEKWRGKSITARTIKKELATLRCVCNWANHPDQGYLEKVPNFTKLAYGKDEQAPQFMTWSEIEDKVRKGGSEKLWDSLFLDVGQIDECLDFVKGNAQQPFVYPMFMFVAKTGARRSEMARCRLEDLNLDDAKPSVVLREKKRDKTVRETFRRVYLAPSLVVVLRNWLKIHPGGAHLFCMTTTLKALLNGRMTGKKRAKPEPLAPNLARYYFEETLADSKWGVIKGFHVFRHSFASNLAAAGKDPRIIDELMGHQTEAMRKRYRHLFPTKMQDAVVGVYQ